MAGHKNLISEIEINLYLTNTLQYNMPDSDIYMMSLTI